MAPCGRGKEIKMKDVPVILMLTVVIYIFACAVVYSQTDPRGQGDHGDLMDQVYPDIKHKETDKEMTCRSAGGNDNIIQCCHFFHGMR